MCIGGLAIIACILGILAFLGFEVVPFLRSADVAHVDTAAMSHEARGILVDEHRSHVVGVDAASSVRAMERGNNQLAFEDRLTEESIALLLVDPARDEIATLSPSGQVTWGRIGFDVHFEGQGEDRVRVTTVDWDARESGDLLASEEPVPPQWNALATVAGSDAGRYVFAAQAEDGRLHTLEIRHEESFLSTEPERVEERSTTEPLPPLAALWFERDLRNAYGVRADGHVLWFRVDGCELELRQSVELGESITASALLLGDQCLMVGTASGAIEGLFLARGENEALHLVRARSLPPLGGAVREIAPSRRDRSFITLDATGILALHHATTQRRLWTASEPIAADSALCVAPKSDALFTVGSNGEVDEYAIDNSHPEVSWRALFGKVWYENYPEPEYVWQSSGSSAVEPKLSLVPLLFGTIKGTLFALFLSIPLGVLGAIYTAQFLHPSLRRFLKPTVEIMASLPSVVLGFLAGLWLAPHIEGVLPGLVLALILLPLFLVAAGFGWSRLPLSFRHRFPPGSELLPFAVASVGCFALSLALGGAFEGVVFAGDYRQWFDQHFGLVYDQRNAIIVGIAMGFAVIPIIFAISEDAISNVPRHLISGSLAMGATRWQTVTKVILPTASPGIFSAIIIGFGRAIGETMIVLMGSGNTPVLDWNPFNGMRTLSANIAYEIPEAPEHGTLYRTLFLAALLLFLVTFLLNTVADLVRQHLRRRYANL